MDNNDPELKRRDLTPHVDEPVSSRRRDRRWRRLFEEKRAWSKNVGEFIAAHAVPVALREGVLYVRVLQPALHYELEQISKPEILRKLKQRFGGKTIRDIRFPVG